MATITKLSAVNRILIASGLSPVTSLDDEGSADSRIVEIMLEDATLDIQLQGLAVSTYTKVFTPDSVTGEILLSSDISNVSMTVGMYTTTLPQTELIQLAIRGNKLMNVSEQTYDFSSFSEVVLTVEEQLSYDDLPLQQQREIIAIATLRYQSQTSGDPAVMRQLESERQMFRAQSRAHDVGARSASIFTAQTPARGAVNRNSIGWSGNARYLGW